MKVPAILNYTKLALGLFIFILVGCTGFDDSPEAVLTRYDLSPQILETIFTSDIPKEVRNVDNFLDKVKQNGMIIHEGASPPEIYSLDGNYRVGVKFNVANDCIYDGKTPSNSESLYGKYEDTIEIFIDPSNKIDFLADVSYKSVGDIAYPQYPDGLDKGSGQGHVSGNGNNFTIFYKVRDGNFDNIPYEAIWIISGTVTEPGMPRGIIKVTKCMIMLKKGEDREDKVANSGTIRIFKDESTNRVK